MELAVNIGVKLLLALVEFALLIVFIAVIRNGLAGFLYQMEDETTGFLKVRERSQAASRAALAELEECTVEDHHGAYSLTLGSTASSGHIQPLVIPGDFRTTHMYVVGASGAGKSSLLKNLIQQDIKRGMGVCVIDPHGDLVADTIPFLGRREAQTIVLDLGNLNHMLGYNPLERKDGVLVAEQVAKILLAFKRVWGDSWGARMEDILRHTLALLIEHGYTLHEFSRVLTDADFRAMLLAHTSNGQTREFFHGRYQQWNSKERQINIESSLNKVSAFLADPRIGLPLAQQQSSFNIRELMDSGGILLVNLAKGRLGLGSDLFGALLMADIETSFLTRPAGERQPFALYADEFQNVATESFETVLTEARKFGLCLTMAHQSLAQLDQKLVSLILGNAQTQIYFRVARQDAERLSKESANIVDQLNQQESRLMQETPKRFNLQELWEVAFNSLATLPQRRAYVMVKGILDHPEEIRTMDNLPGKTASFGYGPRYRSFVELDTALVGREQQITVGIEEYLGRIKRASKPSQAKDRGSARTLDHLPE